MLGYDCPVIAPTIHRLLSPLLTTLPLLQLLSYIILDPDVFTTPIHSIAEATSGFTPALTGSESQDEHPEQGARRTGKHISRNHLLL